ncbi:MAG TPA: hypothetical protein VJA47_05285 [archaeon]|nr:hypothetical protein [archaeon]
MLDKDEKFNKVWNVSVNWALLMTGGFQMAFVEGAADLAEKFADSFAKSFEVVGSKAERVFKDIKKEMPAEIVKFLKDTRDDIKLQGDQGARKKLEKLLTEDKCNEIINIAERDKFGLPPITEELSDEAIFGYLVLDFKKDEKYNNMMIELGKKLEKQSDKRKHK